MDRGNQIHLDKIWKGILNLKSAVRNHSSEIQCCWLHPEDGEVSINKQPDNYLDYLLILCNKSRPDCISQITTFVLSPNLNATPINQKGLGINEILFLRKYLPYCFLSIKSKRLKRAVTVTHFAQTLDAKIATAAGDSKWIGNQENLIHAHRMRALCDGVLVGRKTVEHDHPRLNVRHVLGDNPIRIVVGNPNSSFESLLAASDERILVFAQEKKNYSSPITSIPITQKNANKTIKPQIILEELYKLGIYAIYIEGGANTTSHFLNAKAVDILQLHIAPLIFGSGKDSIVLPHIEMVKEAIQFTDYHFLPFGNSIMFTGFLD